MYLLLLLLLFRNPTAKYTKAEIWVVFCLTLYLHCLISNAIEYTLKNMNMYTHIVYNVCTEQRNHRPGSTVGDQDAVLREIHRETNQNKQVEKQKDGHRAGKKPSCHF